MFGGRRRGGLVRTVGRTAVVAGTASAVVGGVHRRQAKRWEAKDQQAHDQGQADAVAQQQQAPPPTPPAPAGQDDTVSQLERLAKLKEQGVLNDEEFAAEKAKILAG